MFYVINSQTQYVLDQSEDENSMREVAAFQARKCQNIPIIVVQRIAKVTDVVTKTSNLEWEDEEDISRTPGI